MHARAYLACILATSAIVSLSPDADACSPPPPGLTGSIPEAGSTYPANAALFFMGFDISLDAVTVTVDGQAATLTPVTTSPLVNIAPLVATIDPKPNAGQTVVIGGNFCLTQGCTDTTIQFTAGPDDTQAPPVTELNYFDIYDYPDYKSSIGDCSSDSDLAWFFKLTTGPFTQGESANIYTIESSTDANFTSSTVVRKGLVPTSGSGEFPVVFRHTTSILGTKDPAEAFCFRVTTSDAAGNVGNVSPVVCKPCRYRVETGPAPVMPPGEPQWTSADQYPGGFCGMGGGGTGGGGTGGSGTGGNGTGGNGTGGSGTGGNGTGGSGNEPGDDSGGCSMSGAGDSGSSSPWIAGIFLAMAAIARNKTKRRYH